jgi:hypothetical protein
MNPYISMCLIVSVCLCLCTSRVMAPIPEPTPDNLWLPETLKSVTNPIPAEVIPLKHRKVITLPYNNSDSLFIKMNELIVEQNKLMEQGQEILNQLKEKQNGK